MGNSSSNIEQVLPENLDKIDDNMYLLQSKFNFLNVAEIGLNGLVICTKEKNSDSKMLVYINPPKSTPQNRGMLQTIEQETGATVKVILQPGDWHHYQLPSAQELYPEAKMYVASQRNLRKQKKLNATVLDRKEPKIPELEDDFELIPFLGFTQDGMPWMLSGESKGAHRIEFAIFHKPSSTLFLTDMFLPPKSGKSPFAEPNNKGFKLVDVDLAKQSIQRILDLNATRVVFSHGPRDACIVETNSEILKEAYDGLMKAHLEVDKKEEDDTVVEKQETE